MPLQVMSKPLRGQARLLKSSPSFRRFKAWQAEGGEEEEAQKARNSTTYFFCPSFLLSEKKTPWSAPWLAPWSDGGMPGTTVAPRPSQHDIRTTEEVFAAAASGVDVANSQRQPVQVKALTMDV
jgi:hypothetical protein